MKPQPLVSIILPVYNGEIYLADCIDSVYSQHYPHWELILVDDGSTDRTPVIARSFDRRLVYLRQQNQGTGAARNRGLALARGELIGFIDADDLWLPEKLSLQVRTFLEHSDLDIVSGMIQQFISPEVAPEEQKKLVCPAQPQPGYSPLALLMGRAAIDQIGSFSEVLERTDALDWVSRMLGSGLTYTVLPQVVARRRLHMNNKGRQDNARVQAEILKIARAALRHKRQTSFTSEGDDDSA